MVGHTKSTKNNLTISRTQGFTIVELLIVIVVIGILAAVTIIAFNGVQSRAREAQMKADLGSVSKRLLVEKAINNAYPTTLTIGDNNGSIQPGSGGTYQYSVDNGAGTFCVSFVKDGVNFYVNQSSTPVAGLCAGHSASGLPAPVITNYYDFSPNDTATAMTISPGVSIPDGAWMIVVISFTNDTFPTMPTGWTTLLARNTAGTMRNSVFAKIKDSSDSFPMQITVPSGSNTSNGTLFWGTGASAVANWIFGNRFYRDGSTGGQLTTITPAITTTSAQNLILSVSNERTIAVETDVTSVTGATKWFFIPQISNTKIQTITLSSAVQSNPGTTSVVTVTYPNPQINNGLSFQLALPPGN